MTGDSQTQRSGLHISSSPRASYMQSTAALSGYAFPQTKPTRAPRSSLGPARRDVLRTSSATLLPAPGTPLDSGLICSTSDKYVHSRHESTKARCSARSPFCSGYVAFPRGLSPVLPVATICIFSRVRPPVCQVKVMTGGSSSHTVRHTKLVTSIRCRWPGQLHRLADPWITSLHLCHIEMPIGSGGPRLNDLRYIGWCPGRFPSLVRCFLSVILSTILFR